MPERKELLLEIGCEEIPAPWLGELTQQLARRFQELAEKERLEPSAIEAFSTPRRLVLRADVLSAQADREEKVWGPSLKVARDPSGAWTSAAQGFAKKSGVRPEDLQQAPKDPASPGDAYLLALKKTAGRPTPEVLGQVLAALLRALAFPKRMSWDAWLEDGKGAFPFGRPIRWLVALLGGQVVPFQIHALALGAKGNVVVRSGDATYGHRFFPRGKAGSPIRVDSFDDLRTKLREHRVVLEARDRDAILQAQLAAGEVPATEVGTRLVAEWRELVEWPQVVFGTIPQEFRGLPAEVLETVLVHHQKYVPIATEPGGPFERFAAVTNTEADAKAQAEIARGMERVVVARLRDAAFFLREDLKRPLADRVDDLAGVTFHRDLGSYREKADRMAALIAGPMARHFVSAREAVAAQEAARLAKADLTTLMVREFPELQGIMGSLYLDHAGASAAVTRAVRWHYLPVSIEEDSAPAGAFTDDESARVFAAVSLADKIDTLAGYFRLGSGPKGSSDPFGLRRAAQGVIRVLLDFWPGDTQPSVSEMVEFAVSSYGDASDRTKLVGAIELFMLDRIEHVFNARGFPKDEIDACVYAAEPEQSVVFPTGRPQIRALENVRDCFLRLRALHKVRTAARTDFDHLAIAFKRANNILVQAKTAGELLLGCPYSDEYPAGPERDLHLALERTRRWGDRPGSRSKDEEYEEVLRGIAAIRPAVDEFFDKVMVRDSDPEIRRRRLELMNLTVRPIYRIADISKLGG